MKVEQANRVVGSTQVHSRLWSRILETSTKQLLRRAGLGIGAYCLDVGCGEGDVSQLMSCMVGPGGRVLGIDHDAAQVQTAQELAQWRPKENLQFEQAALQTLPADQPFDFVYARFLLSQSSDPRQEITRMLSITQPHGAVVVEDMEFAGGFCHPASRAYQHYLDLYQQLYKKRHGDANLGPRLPTLLRQAGCQNVRMKFIQPAGCRGDVKSIPATTLESIRPALLVEGLSTNEELDLLVAQLQREASDKEVITSLPRIFQAWGYKS